MGKMAIDKKIIEEIQRYRSITNYINEQGVDALAPPPVPDDALGGGAPPPAGDTGAAPPPAEGAIPPPPAPPTTGDTPEIVDVDSDDEVEEVGAEGKEGDEEVEEVDITDLIDTQKTMSHQPDDHIVRNICCNKDLIVLIEADSCKQGHSKQIQAIHIPSHTFHSLYQLGSDRRQNIGSDRGTSVETMPRPTAQINSESRLALQQQSLDER